MSTKRAIILVPVDDQVLRQLTAVAKSDTNADEVTPPLTPGGTWTPPRVAWFQEYHRSRRTGLDGPYRETTWAILIDDDPVGAARLQVTETEGELEAGIWLARTVRTTGVAGHAVHDLLNAARAWGADAIRANTTSSNVAAQRLLRSAGFEIATPTADGHVRAVFRISDSRRW